MKKTAILILCVILCAALTLSFTGCKASSPSSSSSEENPESNGASKARTSQESGDFTYHQSELTEPEELSISEEGKVTVIIDTLAKSDTAEPEGKAVFLAVKAKKSDDIALRYTYDTGGKEGVMLCCDVNDSDTDETALKPIYSMDLTQSSAENYGEIWMGGGAFLDKGTNLFYLSGGSQSVPCRMTLELTFFEPDEIESICLYPAEA